MALADQITKSSDSKPSLTTLPGKTCKYKNLAIGAHLNGHNPFPSAPKKKHPKVKGWTDKEMTDALIKSANWKWGVCIRTDTVHGFDIDITNHKLAEKYNEKLQDKGLKGSPVRFTQATKPKKLIPLHVKGLGKKMVSKSYIDSEGRKNQIEFLAGKGCQFKAHGDHPAGCPYEWENPDGKEWYETELVEISLLVAKQLIAEFESLAESMGLTPEKLKVSYQFSSQGDFPKTAIGTPSYVYNHNTSMDEMLISLEDCGWQQHSKGVYGAAESITLTRPGKETGDGGSGTLFIGEETGTPIFYNFSSSAELEEGSYTPFSLYCELNFNSNYREMYEYVKTEHGIFDPLYLLEKEGEEIRLLLEEGNLLDAAREMSVDLSAGDIRKVFENCDIELTEEVKEFLLNHEVTGPINQRVKVEYKKGNPYQYIKDANAVLLKKLPEYKYCKYRRKLGGIDNGEFAPYNDSNLEQVLDENTETIGYVGTGNNKVKAAIGVPDKSGKRLRNLMGEDCHKLEAILSHPIVRQSKVMGLNNGWENGYYFHHGGGFQVDERPVDDCYRRIVEICCEDILFKDADEGAVRLVGAMLMSIVRQLHDGGCYGINIISNQPGTGKSSLINTIVVPITGNAFSSTPYDSKNFRKTLVAQLVNSRSFMVYDNLPGGLKLDDATLADIMTSGTLHDRVLYSSTTEELHGNSVFIIAGNNITLSEELTRRFITIKLHSSMESPSRRNVKNPNLLKYLQDNRREIIGCLLKILLKGDKTPRGGAGNFPFFDEMVRWPLYNITGMDILDGLDDSRADSDDINIKGVALHSLYEEYEGKKFQAKDVLKRIQDKYNGLISPYEEYEHLEDLRSILIEINGLAAKNGKSCSNALQALVGTVVDNMELTVVPQSRTNRKPKSFQIQVH